MFSVKDIRKLVVVSIIGACAVFVANLFLNFYFDIEQLEISKTNPMIQTYYDAQNLAPCFFIQGSRRLI